MALPTHDLNLLAYAVSFGNVHVGDFVQAPKTTARLSKTYLKRTNLMTKRLKKLVDLGLLEEGQGSRYVPTGVGEALLAAEGYAPNAAGVWIKPGQKTPSWA